jgi:hypothetical protein
MTGHDRPAGERVAMAEERQVHDLSTGPDVAAGNPDELGLHLWVSSTDVVVHNTPPLKQVRAIAEGREAGFFTMVGASTSPPRQVAAFTFSSEGDESADAGRAATGHLRLDARFTPPFDGGLGAPVAAMAGTLKSEPAEPHEVIRLTGTVDYVLASGETISDHPITISVSSTIVDEFRKSRILCSNTANQSYYMLCIYN